VRNWDTITHEVEVEDLRGHKSSAFLDQDGFQFGVHVTKFTEFDQEAAIEAEYYPESIELLKAVTGAIRVVLFDHSMFLVKPVRCGTDSAYQPRSD
jgi:hypothetical protein